MGFLDKLKLPEIRDAALLDDAAGFCPNKTILEFGNGGPKPFIF